jgi:DNA polymerase III subunit epsilon
MTFLNTLIKNDGTIELKKFDGSSLPNFDENYNKDCTKVCFLDLETTGLDTSNDKIIEIAVKIAAINKESGQLVGVLDNYQSFQDPEELIKDSITKINGISNEMVQDQSINWDTVKNIINQSDIIVAHNAVFDRSFMDRYLPLSNDKIWACSVNDIDWSNRGFSISKQEILCIWHGFYFESHRAMSDVDALINLVSHESYKSNTPIGELINNAYTTVYKISANNSPYETKDILKARGYHWNGEAKYWFKIISFEEIEIEKEWNADNIYNGTFLGDIIQILNVDKYK